MCSVGSYYEILSKTCEQCPLGYYQNDGGQLSCKSCPNGQTTTQKGATSSDQCKGTYANKALVLFRPLVLLDEAIAVTNGDAFQKTCQFCFEYILAILLQI